MLAGFLACCVDVWLTEWRECGMLRGCVAVRLAE